MNGKGSARRPEDRAKVAREWERIFGRENPFLPPEYRRALEALTKAKPKPTR